MLTVARSMSEKMGFSLAASCRWKLLFFSAMTIWVSNGSEETKTTSKLQTV